MTFLCLNCDREINQYALKYGYIRNLGNKI